MDRRATRSSTAAARRFREVYKECSDGVFLLVTPSATGKGVHIRWQYPESTPDSQDTIQLGHVSAAKPLTHEFNIDLDDTYAHLFEGSLSSIGSLSSLHDLQSAADDNSSASLFDGSLSSISSASSHDGLAVTTLSAVDGKAGEVPGATNPHPNRIVFRPDDFTDEAVRKREMRAEQRFEDIFQVQWEKMRAERQAALRVINSWTKMDHTEYDALSDEASDDSDDDHMEIEEDHAGVISDSCTRTASELTISDRGSTSENNTTRRPLERCDTVIIENPYQRGRNTSPPPVYPQEWVARRLAGRESTESILDSH